MKTRLQLVCLALLVALVAAGCVPPEVAIETPTTAPATATTAPPATDTAAAPPATDTAAPVPPTETAPPATETTPPASPTADPTGEAILILEPGLTSAVTSPVRVAGEADPTFEQNLVIQITDQDGAVLTTTPTTIQAELGNRGPYSADVAFSVPSDQPGRISVYSASARDGGLVHLASVEVTLLAAGGTASLLPAAPHAEIHQISEPNLLELASGGSVHVEGFSEYVFEGTLNLALCGEGGSGAPHPICGTADNVIAEGFTMLQAPDIGLPGPFETDLPFTIAGPTRARLAVYSLSARDGGLLHLNSVEISLAP
jgi:hypothetical protein